MNFVASWYTPAATRIQRVVVSMAASMTGIWLAGSEVTGSGERRKGLKEPEKFKWI